MSSAYLRRIATHAILSGMSMTPEEIERCAAERDMSIAALCRRAGIWPSTFFRWRAGQTGMSMEIYERLEAALAAVQPVRQQASEDDRR